MSEYRYLVGDTVIIEHTFYTIIRGVAGAVGTITTIYNGTIDVQLQAEETTIRLFPKDVRPYYGRVK